MKEETKELATDLGNVRALSDKTNGEQAAEDSASFAIRELRGFHHPSRGCSRTHGRAQRSVEAARGSDQPGDGGISSVANAREDPRESGQGANHS